MDSDDRSSSVADLADLIVGVARKISARELHEEDLVPLTHLEILVMQYVDRHPGARSSEIGAELGLRSANTSGALRALEAKGMVRRVHDPADRRVVRVEPTALALENLHTVRSAWTRMLAPALPDGDIAVVIGFLRELDDRFHPRPM